MWHYIHKGYVYTYGTFRGGYFMQVKKIIKGLVIFLLAMIAFFCVWQKTSNIVQASVTDDNVLNVPPGGISLQGYFLKGSFTDNNAAVMTNSNGVDVVRLTNGKNQTGAIWSDSNATDIDGNGKNYLNVDKKQTITMWMYFGTILSPFGVPDGMAFVLQNDDNGLGAISKDSKGAVNHGQSLGVWGMDSTSTTGLTGKNTIQSQAIQKSFALEFDTYSNMNKNHSWKETDTDDSLLNGRGNSFDTMPYSGDNSYLKDPHIAWNYPAEAGTYKQLSSNFGSLFFGNSIMGMYHHLGSDNRYNGAGIDFSYGKNSNNTYQDAWNHMTIEYIPDGDGKHAQIHYKFRDKNVDGTARLPLIDATADINLDEFQLKNTNKLRYGFTGSTGPDADITNAIVFESMPSLVNAEANAYTVDKTNNTKIKTKDDTDVTSESGQNSQLMDDQAKSMATATTVNPNDDLTLNYMLHYLSGEESTNGIKATIKVPDNVTVTSDADNNIGKIYYISKPDDNGNVQKMETNISKDSLDDKGVLTCDIDTLGDTDAGSTYWETARVELNATADSLPTGTTKLTVPSTLNTFEGKNYKVNIQPDAFDIVKPSNTLHITTDMADPTEVQLGNMFDLTGTISFEHEETVDKNDMYINYTIDNNPTIMSQDNTSGADFTIKDLETGTKSGQLDIGDHTIKVQVIDDNYAGVNGVETLASNVLEYHIKVTNKSVVVTPEKDELTVNDNEPVDLKGTYLHSDGSSTVPEKGKSDVSYTITNDGEKSQDTVVESQDNDGNYKISLKPYAYDKDEATSITDYQGKTGLKVGKNTVTISIIDDQGHKSQSKDVIVNVPDVTPTLTADKTDYNFVQGEPISLTANIGYPGDYQVTPGKLTWYVNANGNETIRSYDGDTSVATPVSQNFTIDPAANGMDNGSKDSYPVSIYYSDPYGRTSEKVNYNVTVLDKTASLESGDYSFKTVRASRIPDIVQRNGKWNLAVKSVMTGWTLTAKAGKMVKDAGQADEETLDGNMIFISPKDNKTYDLSKETLIQSDSNNSNIETTYIGNDWNDNQGVLLDLNSSSVAGLYKGEIEWNLTNSL